MIALVRIALTPAGHQVPTRGRCSGRHNPASAAGMGFERAGDRCGGRCAVNGRPTPPPGEAPLLCENCSAGCIGHDYRCEAAGCECPKRWPRSLRALEARWTRLANGGNLALDRSIIATGLRVAAEQFERDARTSAEVPRTREQFLLQAAQCRVIAEAIEP